MQHQIPLHRTSNPIRLTAQAGGSNTRLFFGGSFDPPHCGHSTLPRLIGDSIAPNTRLIYVPAGRSPFKEAIPAADHHRVAMLEIALSALLDWEIWTQELADAPLNPDQPSFWADTWSLVQKLELSGQNRFLIGADQALMMHRWQRYDSFWKDAIVMLRDGPESVDSLVDRLRALGVWSESEIELWRSLVVVVPKVDASSSHIRTSLGDHSKRTNPIDGLDPKVHDYIRQHSLYL